MQNEQTADPSGSVSAPTKNRGFRMSSAYCSRCLELNHGGRARRTVSQLLRPERLSPVSSEIFAVIRAQQSVSRPSFFNLAIRRFYADSSQDTWMVMDM